MTDPTPAAAPTAAARPGAPRYAPPPITAPRPPRPDAPAHVALAILAHALVVGIAADALFRGGPAGLAFPLWIAIFAHAAVSMASRAGRAVSREATAWFAAAILFAAGVAWRDASLLQFLDGVVALAALGMAGVALGNAQLAIAAARLRDTVSAFVLLAVNTAFGILPLAFGARLRKEIGERWAPRVGPGMRVAIIVGAVGLVFGSLLLGADPILASFVAIPEFDVGTLIGHGILIGFFGWITAGWARGALIDDLSTPRLPDHIGITLGKVEVTAALGTLILLFSTFVVAQLGWFFGGESFLQARTGLTAAEYARQGFFQMVAIVMLVVPLLVATRATLRPGRDLARLHTALALPVIGLLGAIVVSAVTRMQLYVHYYGLTTDRLYPLVFMGWLSIVLIWLAVTVLRGHGRLFVAGAAISGLATLAALNIAAPDAIVARVNIDRAAHLPPVGAVPTLDLPHLANLSGEAASLATDAVLAPPVGDAGTELRKADDAQRCRAARRLLNRWGQSRAAERVDTDASWRTWNAGESAALDVVGRQHAALSRVRHEACIVAGIADQSDAGH